MVHLNRAGVVFVMYDLTIQINAPHEIYHTHIYSRVYTVAHYTFGQSGGIKSIVLSVASYTVLSPLH